MKTTTCPQGRLFISRAGAYKVPNVGVGYTT